MKVTRMLAISLLIVVLVPVTQAGAQSIRTPEDFFGFKIGTDGELARYPKVLEYLQHLEANSDRILYKELGRTTLDNPYVLAIFSSAENLKNLDRLVEINNRLANPRGMSEQEAAALIDEGRSFYFLYATIHSTELGNGQAIIEIAHDLTTKNTPKIQEILNNSVMLMVPSQNPDGQILVIDHFYKTKGTSYRRNYPDLYHHYTGHDDNRDWFMFTQKETLLNIQGVQNTYRPHITHDMHQMGSSGARIFVPPFADPYDPNIHPIIAQGQAAVGLAMASALVAEGKGGVNFHQRFDLWTPARQYMVYHGQPRILTEIASVNLADPIVDPRGRPMGPQETRWNFPIPYAKSEWHLRDIVEYGYTAALAGISHIAKYRATWLENFYRIHRDWVNRTDAPYAFVIPASQRDPFETYELLQILKIGDVEIHQAKSSFAAGGKDYAAGSYVIKTAQPYGAFAKTMLEIQKYPDLRYYEGGPPIPPYDVTGHTLGYLMGVEVNQIEQPFEADLALLDTITPATPPTIAEAGAAYLIGPESNAGFMALAQLQKANIPVYRSAGSFDSGDNSYSPGTWIIPAGSQAKQMLEGIGQKTGLIVQGVHQIPNVSGFRIKQGTRIGLWKSANSMPGGWLKWLMEQYDFNHTAISSEDFSGDLSARYDAILLPAGTSRRTIVQGLDSRTNDETWRWAYGVGEQGWQKLQQWVKSGGTLVALGSASETARDLLDLPISGVLPQRSRGSFRGMQRPQEAQVPEGEIRRRLRETFQSPANLMDTLSSEVIDSSAVFFCPGSLLRNQFNTNHPIAYGMPTDWPVFFRSDQAYRLRPDFQIKAEAVSRYPADGPVVASGWLLGEKLLRDQANVVAFKVGQGTVVIMGSQIAFRTQPRATLKLLFNALFQGPASKIDAAEMARASQ